MKYAVLVLVAASACVASPIFAACHAGDDSRDRVRIVVDRVIRPMMRKDDIPGVAVALTVAGKSYVYDYGVASKQTRQPVARDTLFEIGSVTKTFTATLASWAQVENRLSLSDKTARFLPTLEGSAFGSVSLLELGTHTSGGLPLQVPDYVTTDAQLMQYLKTWRPAYAPGTFRTYSNPGIGMLGVIAAQSMGEDFRALVEQQLFPAFGMKNSFINVPQARIADYAQGYTDDGTPVRMSPGVLSPQTYGVKSTAADMLSFIEANMNSIDLANNLRRAIAQTHAGYFKAGPMTQDLVWEQYPYPVALAQLLEGNSPKIIFDATRVSKIEPPLMPRDDVWINKTGSTNGFGAYVAFVPEKRLGIVILANKSFPIADRVRVAFTILTSLAELGPEPVGIRKIIRLAGLRQL